MPETLTCAVRSPLSSPQWERGQGVRALCGDAGGEHPDSVWIVRPARSGRTLTVANIIMHMHVKSATRCRRLEIVELGYRTDD
jgi:hypothetical protein